MAAAVAAAAGLFGLMLVRPMLAALGGKKAQLRAANRNASRADARADKASSEAAKLKKANAGLQKALELARMQDAPATPATTKPPKDEPKIYDVPPVPPEPTKADTLKDLGTEQPTKRDWAERLYAYALREVREGRSANLGSKGQPNPNVLAAQRGMEKLAVDGIYGDKTRARGKELLGKPFPARETAKQAAKKKATPAAPDLSSLANLNVFQKPKPTSQTPGPRPGTPVQRAPVVQQPAKRSAVQAAEDMLAHAKELIGNGQGAKLGNKSAPSSFVAAAQRDMGALAVDGIYGPAVRKRGKELTGKTFPGRV